MGCDEAIEGTIITNEDEHKTFVFSNHSALENNFELLHGNKTIEGAD